MKSWKFTFILLPVLSFSPLLQAADSYDSNWSLFSAPVYYYPSVTSDFESNEILNSSWGGTLSAERRIQTAGPFSLRLGGAYTAAPLQPVEDVKVKGSLMEVSAQAGLVYGYGLTSRLTFLGFLDAGMTYGRLSTGKTTTYGSGQSGIGLDFRISDAWSARLETAAVYKSGLTAGLGAVFGISYHIPVSEKSSPLPPRMLDFYSIEVNDLFPSLRSQYEDSRIGSATITNTGKKNLENLRVSFIIRQYMDAPRESYTINNLSPGESVQVPLYALFNDSVLGITESTKVSGEILVDYNGMEESRGTSVLVYDRNALTWSDDRKAAAFVSSKDPWVMDLTGNIMATVMAERNPELTKNLQTAIAIHEGLKAYGISYMLSPNRPFAKEIVDTATVDTLKYPRQTLGFRAGDCADLSVLYASCFEAAGIETAFITVPGHIFIAADLGMSASRAAARGMNLNDLIVRDDKVWVPIETTMRSAGFTEVWKKAAEQWRNASGDNKAALYPVHEAWNLYAPVGLPADGSAIKLPRPDEILRNFTAEKTIASNNELNARLDRLGPLDKGPSYAKAANNRGILYAKYGFYPDAVKYLKEAANAGNASALVNLGNISLLQSDAETAYGYYREAAEQLPRNARLQFNLAKAAAASGNQNEADAALEELRRLDPELAEQYAHVAVVSGSGSSMTRAAEAEDTRVLWF